MKKVFASGSCRLLTSINRGKGVIEPLHSMYRNFFGANFLGKFHNTKQHIQFIDWIHERIDIPEDYYQHIFTHVNKSFCPRQPRSEESWSDKRKAIRNGFNHCDVYMFEICSTKIYEVNDIQIQCELWRRAPSYEQNESQVISDLNHLVKLLPVGAKVLLQCHFRPNIYREDQNLVIPNRELIYNALKKFSDSNPNVILWDPSQMIKQDKRCIGREGNHFTPHGHSRNFSSLCNLIEDVSIS